MELILHSIPSTKQFIPQPCLNPEPIELSYPEFEALKLIDLEGLTQEEAGKKMGTSRGTVWRLVTSGRKKIMQAIAEARPLILVEKGELRKMR